MNDRFVSLHQIDKQFGDLTVLHRIDLEVREGEILALLGPSGSGKTTCLRLLAGFENPDHGTIEVAGEDVTALPPAKRGFGMVFQHYALFPHLTVGENVAFGLETRGWSRDRIEARIGEMLRLVDLAGFQERRLGQVSGGQQQRVALARALAPQPKLLLLDEPLSNLDPMLRERTRRHLRETIDRVGITTVLVTHEQEEAFDLGDRVAVLHSGRLHQVATPEQLYTQPASRFVATFIGRSNILPVQLASVDGGKLAVRVGQATWSWTGADETSLEGLEVETPVDLVVRPEALMLVASDSEAHANAADSLAAQVVHRRYAGPVSYFRVRLLESAYQDRELEVLAPAAAARPGDRVRIRLDPSPHSPRPLLFPREATG